MIKHEIAKLHQRNLPRYLLLIALNWAVIGLSSWGAISSGHIALYVLAAFVVAGRQHALFVLLHEQVHRNFTKKQWVGDFIANFFCGNPLGINTNRYRAQHLPHHSHPNTAKDPYWEIFNTFDTWKKPKDKMSYIKTLLKDLLGLNYKDALRLIRPWSNMTYHFSQQTREGIPPLGPSERVCLYLFWATTLGVIVSYQLWAYVGLWMVSQLFVLNIFMRLRAMSEHPFVALESSDLQTQIKYSNTIIPGFVEGFFFAPHHAGHHTLHHMYPSMPTFHFPQAHKLMMREDETYRKNTQILDGYLWGRKSVFRSLTQDTDSVQMHQTQRIA